MKLDLMVYGRGQQREDGYQMFACPPYWTDEMLYAMSEFNGLWTDSDRSNSQTAAFADYQNPWGHTYMFICMPEPYCCALIRCTRAEGDEPGTWLKEVRNYDIWSMEGLCCPYKKREMFWAMIPSIILYMERDNTSFYGRLRHGTIEKTVEIPDELLYNPYQHDVMDEAMLNILHTENAKNKMVELCNTVEVSSAPVHFVFGPLSELFYKEVGNHYGVKEVFSTVSGGDKRDYVDVLTKAEVISCKKSVVSTTEYKLVFGLDTEKKEVAERFWKLSDLSLNNGDDTSITGKKEPFNLENGVSMFNVMAEADAIIKFTQRLGWKQSDPDGGRGKKYTFIKEE